MNNMNIEETMRFILEQQAQLVVNQQKSDERVNKVESVVLRLANATENRTSGLEQSCKALVDAQIRTEDGLQRLAQSQRELAESQRKLTESQRELAESQKHTDDRLSALIDIVIEKRDEESR